MGMENEKRVNWLLVISVLLFLLSVGVVVSKMMEAGKKSVNCSVDGREYVQGESFTNDEGITCVCSANGLPVCDNEGGSVHVDEVVDVVPSTENLKFTQKFLSALSKEKPDYKKVNVADITQSANTLKIVLEREDYCTQENEAPNAGGFYELTPERVLVTTVTGKDEQVHVKPCLLSNSFEIDNFVATVNDVFKVIYRNELGEEIELKACAYKGVLYSENDVFRSEDGSKVCGCDNGNVECQ